MKKKAKSSSKVSKIEKQVEGVFNHRFESLRALGRPKRVPKQVHFMISTK